MARLPILVGASLLICGPLHAQSLADPPAFDDAMVSETELHAIAGRENVLQVQQTATARNTSTVANNSVSGTSTTGMITIDGSAFQNLTGLSVLSANTGNNVSINAAMNVNVSLLP